MAFSAGDEGKNRGARVAMLTDTGLVRPHNEDACAADDAAGLYVVCDGMGGAAAGEVASAMAVRIFLDQARRLEWHASPASRLQDAVQVANTAVFAQAQGSPWLQGMGTTLVALAVDQPSDAPSDALWTVHVGDSRCYRLRDRTLDLLTLDHSYVDEQMRLGLMTPLQAEQSPLRNVITRAVGSHEAVEATVTRHTAEPGDVYLLCSDGITGELDDATIADVLRGMDGDLHAGAQALVQLANRHGGADNLTVVLVRT